MTLVMTDHLGWTYLADASPSRVVWTPPGVYQRFAVAGATIVDDKGGTVSPALIARTVLGEGARAALPDSVLSTWGRYESVVRLATPSLWEAVGTAIVRQVIRAKQASVLYSLLCERLGERLETSSPSPLCGFPRPARVLAQPTDDLAASGLGFKAATLQRAAEAFMLEPHREFAESSPDDALAFLQRIKGVGRWTSAVAVVDRFAEWRLYPFEDLAVQKWGTREWDVTWPREPAAFRAAWLARTEPHTAEITCYALASTL